MVWNEFEALWLFCPESAAGFVGRKSFAGLEPSGEVVGGDEVCEVTAQLIVSLGEETLDGGFFEGSIHALDLAVGPWVLGFGQAVVDVGLGAGELEGVGAEALSVEERA
jgi:hypothetical protein